MTMRPDLVIMVGSAGAVALVSSAVPLLAPELQRQGVRIGDPDAVPGVGGAPVLVVPRSPEPPPDDPSDVRGFLTPSLDSVTAVIASSGARRARIVFCPERQDRMIERGYRAAVARGFAGTLPERFPRRLEPLLDQAPAAAEFRSLVGVSDLRVLPYELVAAGPVAFVGAVLGALEPARPIDLAALREWLVPCELGSRGVRIATALNAHLDTDGERERVRDFVLSNFSVPVTDSPPVLDAQRRTQVLAAHGEANRAFFAEFAPEYPLAAYDGPSGLEALASAIAPVRITPRGVAAPGASPGSSRSSALLRRVSKAAASGRGREATDFGGQGGS